MAAEQPPQQPHESVHIWIILVELEQSLDAANATARVASLARTKNIAEFCIDGLSATREAFNTNIPTETIAALASAARNEVAERPPLESLRSTLVFCQSASFALASADCVDQTGRVAALRVHGGEVSNQQPTRATISLRISCGEGDSQMGQAVQDQKWGSTRARVMYGRVAIQPDRVSR